MSCNSRKLVIKAHTHETHVPQYKKRTCYITQKNNTPQKADEELWSLFHGEVSSNIDLLAHVKENRKGNKE